METLELLNLDLSNIEKNQNKHSEQETSLSKSLRDVEKFEKKHGKGFDSLLARGACYYNAKDYQKCEFYFERAAKLKYDISIISALMKLYSKTNRMENMLPHLEKSKETLGNHFSFWQFAGFAYAELEMPDETADNLLKARELGSKGELTINLLLKSLGKQKRYEEQFKVSQEEIEKENLTKVTVESFVSSCIKLRKFKEVLDFFDNTTFDWQSNAILLAFAGIAHQSFNDNVQETLRLNKKALEVDPDNIEIRWNLHQSVLPPSYHPETGSYKWINSPSSTALAEAPEWLMDGWIRLSEVYTKPTKRSFIDIKYKRTRDELDYDSSRVEEGLKVYCQDHKYITFSDYDHWNKIGMALHSLSKEWEEISDGKIVDLHLDHWLDWSSQQDNYDYSACMKKWEKDYKEDGKIKINTFFDYCESNPEHKNHKEWLRRREMWTELELLEPTKEPPKRKRDRT